MQNTLSPAAHGVLPPLSLDCVLSVFAFLTCGERLLCMAVSASWRKALSHGSLWRDVDISTSSGEAVVNAGFLRCVSRVARGHLRSLDVSGLLPSTVGDYHGLTPRASALSFDTLSEVLASHPTTLRHCILLYYVSASLFDGCCVDSQEGQQHLQALLERAPFLQSVEIDVSCSAPHVRSLLQNEAPFQALRMRVFEVLRGDEASTAALPAGLAAHPSLKALTVASTPLQSASALNALALASLHIDHLRLWSCHLQPGCVTGLLRAGTVSKLFIINGDEALFGETAATAFGKAVRKNTMLKILVLREIRLWSVPAIGLAVVEAMMGHPTLEGLDFGRNSVSDTDRLAVGACLGRLVAANTPALKIICVVLCDLRDEGLRGIFQALPANLHISTLNCRLNDITERFAAEVLHAVSASTSLVSLDIQGDDPLTDAVNNGAPYVARFPDIQQAMAIASSRRR